MSEFFEALDAFWTVLPGPIAAAAVLLAGWALAVFARFILTRILIAAKFDKMSEKTGFGEFLRKGGVGLSPSRLVGKIAYWAALIVTLVLASSALDIAAFSEISRRIFESMTSWLAALLIVVVGAIIVSFVSNFVLTIARNAAVENSRLLAKAIKWTGNILVAALALDQIGLGKSIISGILGIVFSAIALALALAFGLGCKDMARDAMQNFIRGLREKGRGAQGAGAKDAASKDAASEDAGSGDAGVEL